MKIVLVLLFLLLMSVVSVFTPSFPCPRAHPFSLSLMLRLLHLPAEITSNTSVNRNKIVPKPSDNRNQKETKKLCAYYRVMPKQYFSKNK